MQRTWSFRRIILNILPVISIILLILFDQITKTVCKNSFENHGWTFTEIIPDFFSFRYATNSGAAAGFLSGYDWAQTFFKVLTSFAIVGFYAYFIFIRRKNYKTMTVGMILILSGTIGNFIDRLAYNEVIDFISFKFGSFLFPTFNLADAFMTIGIILFIVHFLFLDKHALFRKNGKKDLPCSKQ